MFGINDARGWSFEVQGECIALDNRVNCSVRFNKSTFAVLGIGSSGRGDFEPNADIAGAGILYTLLVQAWLIFLVAWAFMLKDLKTKNLAFLYSTLLTFSDIFTILAFVVVANFILAAKCTLSTYHYHVAMDSVLIACSTLVVTFTTSRHHYWKTAAGILRAIATVVIFALLAYFSFYLILKHGNTDFPEWSTRNVKKRKDSSLLLPISCFLDPDLIAYENPYATKSKDKLTGVKLDRIGRPIKGYSLPEFWLYLILLISFALGIYTHYRGWRRAREHKNRYADVPTLSMKVCWCVIFLSCLATNLFCSIHISLLRTWMRESGWMKSGSEDEVSSVGQLMPILALGGGVLLSVLEHKELGRKDQAQQDIPLMPLIHRNGYQGI